MSNTNNKVKFGLKNVHYAMATISADGTAQYATPKPLKGAVSLAQDPQGESTVFRADDVDYYTGTSNNGYSGDLELALIPDDFRQDVFGEYVDENDLQVEEVVNDAKYFALLFEFAGDAKKTRHVMYKCTATRPAISSNTTPEGAVEPVTETTTIKAGIIHVAGINKDVVKARCYEGDSKYEAWYEDVVLPVAKKA